MAHQAAMQARQAAETDPATIAALGASDVVAERRGAAENPLAWAGLLDTLAGDVDENVRILVAHHPETAPETLGRLASCDSVAVRRATAGHPHAHESTLTVLACDEEPNVRCAVAASSHTPPHLLGGDKLRGDTNINVMCALASNPATPPWALAGLLDHANTAVRHAAAQNPATTSDALMARCTDMAVRAGSVLRTGVDTALLVVLATDSETVRAHIAAHPATDPATLHELLRDDDWDVYEAARDACRERGIPTAHTTVDHTPATLTLFAHSADWRLRFDAAANPDTPVGDLDSLSADDRTQVRINVAYNPSTPPGTLARIAADGTVEERRAVAQHSATRPGTVESLSADMCSSVRCEVARRDALPDAAHERLRGDEAWTVRSALADSKARTNAGMVL